MKKNKSKDFKKERFSKEEKEFKVKKKEKHRPKRKRVFFDDDEIE
jgi:hypothetical protein